MDVEVAIPTKKIGSKGVAPDLVKTFDRKIFDQRTALLNKQLVNTLNVHKDIQSMVLDKSLLIDCETASRIENVIVQNELQNVLQKN